jgi:glycosyltransferase involved in cell wall biosynthesis
VKITILKDCPQGAAGTVVEVSDSTAQRLIRYGLAKPNAAILARAVVDNRGASILSKPSAAIVVPPAISTAMRLPEFGPFKNGQFNPTVPVFLNKWPLSVTCVCPTYNRRVFLPLAIGLFFARTYAEAELLIVDDGEESVADLIPKNLDSRIRYIRLDKKMVLGAKRNFCCEQATGDVIIHWDDDDFHCPGRIEYQIDMLRKMNKHVQALFNILYYNEETQKAYRWLPNPMSRGVNGATLCYTKAWWKEHPFPELPGGEDTHFGNVALARNQIAFVDAKKHIVIRAHGQDQTSTSNRGNTCQSYRSMGCAAVPEVKTDEIPPEFFSPLLTKDRAVRPQPTLGEKDDAVIGVIKNYDWPAIRPYAVSLARCGFTGTKLMFVENITAASRAGLIQNGFLVVDFKTPPAVLAEEHRDGLTFGRHRFKHVIDYLKKNPVKFRNIVWCDVRDVIFQTSPSAWLDANMKLPYRLVAATEGFLAKNDHFNDNWLKRVCPQDHQRLREMEVCCSGTFAGDAEIMLAVFEKIYEMTLASLNVRPYNADQGMFMYIIRNAPFIDITMIPTLDKGFVATWSPSKTLNTSFQIPKDFPVPLFNTLDGIVYTADGKTPFSIVHQYDRDIVWKTFIEKKYA